MAVRKHRSTTSERYSLSIDYDYVLSKAKKRHRHESEFYITAIEMGSTFYSDVSVVEFETIYKSNMEQMFEHWKFESGRWRKEG